MFSYFHKKTLKKHDANNNRKIKASIATYQLMWSAMQGQSIGVGNTKEHSIVVSLTTYDKRINDVYLCIESLFQQTLKADKIILWLSRKNFPTGDLPEILRLQQARGLQVEFRDEDLGSYKKIVYALQSYPDSLIVTVDDDILYPPDMLDQLYRAYVASPGIVYSHRAYQIATRRNGDLNPYDKWKLAGDDGVASPLIFPTGVAGVLYSPGVFDENVLDSEMFMRLCPNADDIWLKAMTLKKGTHSMKIVDGRGWKDRFLTIEGSQTHSLKKQNWRKDSGNDAKLKAVFDHYNLYDRLADSAR